MLQGETNLLCCVCHFWFCSWFQEKGPMQSRNIDDWTVFWDFLPVYIKIRDHPFIVCFKTPISLIFAVRLGRFRFTYSIRKATGHERMSLQSKCSLYTDPNSLLDYQNFNQQVCSSSIQQINQLLSTELLETFPSISSCNHLGASVKIQCPAEGILHPHCVNGVICQLPRNTAWPT